jgi:hypothetical protein
VELETEAVSEAVGPAVAESGLVVGTRSLCQAQRSRRQTSPGCPFWNVAARRFSPLDTEPGTPVPPQRLFSTGSPIAESACVESIDGERAGRVVQFRSNKGAEDRAKKALQVRTRLPGPNEKSVSYTHGPVCPWSARSNYHAELCGPMPKRAGEAQSLVDKDTEGDTGCRQLLLRQCLTRCRPAGGACAASCP